MRTPLIAGNWKMNLNFEQARHLISELSAHQYSANVWVFPPTLYIQQLISEFANSDVKIGAQTINDHDSGAFTGEISASMLADIHCHYTLIGHSERRQYYNESNLSCAKKIKQAHQHHIHPIYCIGERLEERENNQTLNVISTQLNEGLNDIEIKNGITIAYEPVWAIGTGKVASCEQAQDVHAHIRSELHKKYGKETADKIRILYGGSVKADNSKELLSMPDIDGALVGGASLKASEFVNIINNAT